MPDLNNFFTSKYWLSELIVALARTQGFNERTIYTK